MTDALAQNLALAFKDGEIGRLRVEIATLNGALWACHHAATEADFRNPSPMPGWFAKDDRRQLVVNGITALRNQVLERDARMKDQAYESELVEAEAQHMHAAMRNLAAKWYLETVSNKRENTLLNRCVEDIFAALDLTDRNG